MRGSEGHVFRRHPRLSVATEKAHSSHYAYHHHSRLLLPLLLLLFRIPVRPPFLCALVVIATDAAAPLWSRVVCTIHVDGLVGRQPFFSPSSSLQAVKQ